MRLAFPEIAFGLKAVEEVFMHIFPVAQGMVVGNGTVFIDRIFIKIPCLKSGKIGFPVIEHFSQDLVQFDHGVSRGKTEIEMFAAGKFFHHCFMNDDRSRHAHFMIISDFQSFHKNFTVFLFLFAVLKSPRLL